MASFYQKLKTNFFKETGVEPSTEIEEKEETKDSGVEEESPSTEEEQKGPFSRLPDELVIRVLSFLNPVDVFNRVSLVSRRFGQLAQDVALRTELGRGNHGLQQLMDAIASHGFSLRMLIISGHWDPAVLQKRAGTLERLTHISVSGQSFNDAGLIALADHCRRVKSFSMEHCFRINDEAMIYFLERAMDTISHLHVDTHRLDEAVLSHISDCRLLESIHLGSLTGGMVGLEAVLKLPLLKCLSVQVNGHNQNDVLKAFKRSPQLRNLAELNLEGYSGMESYTFRCIVGKCPELNSLKLKSFPDVSNADVIYVLSKCLNLKLLRIGHNHRVTSEVFQYIPLRCMLEMSVVRDS